MITVGFAKPPSSFNLRHSEGLSHPGAAKVLVCMLLNQTASTAKAVEAVDMVKRL